LPDNHDNDRYVGCKLFVHATGLAGVVVGTDGDRAGYLYDVFVSPKASDRAVYDMVSLAVEQGADKLVTYDDRVLTRFFEQFGFQAVAIIQARGAPADWVPEACRSPVGAMGCPDFVAMIRVGSEFRAAGPHPGSSPQPGAIVDAQPESCSRCGQPIKSVRRFDLFGGFSCSRCGFIYVVGTLTVGPRPPAA